MCPIARANKMKSVTKAVIISVAVMIAEILSNLFLSAFFIEFFSDLNLKKQNINQTNDTKGATKSTKINAKISQPKLVPSINLLAL